MLFSPTTNALFYGAGNFAEEPGRGECLLAPSGLPCYCPEVSLLSLQFQSHQIFHVLVVAAAVIHFYAL